MALKIIFMGTPDFSVPILEALHKSEHEIIQVYTQPPKKNRGQKISVTPIHNFAYKNKLIVRSPEKLDADHELKFLRDSKPDVIIVAAYGKNFTSEALKHDKYKIYKRSRFFTA